MMIRMLSARAINRVIFAMLAVALLLAICVPGVLYWKSKAPDRARKRFQDLCGSLHRNVAKFQLGSPILPETLEQLKQIRGIDTIDFSGHPVSLDAAKVCAELDQVGAVAFGKAEVDVTSFVELARMRQLRVIFLSDLANTKGLLTEIGRFQKLDTLYLYHCHIDEISAFSIAKHPRLGKVTLTEATLDKTSLQSLLETQNLRELWLQRTKLNSDLNDTIELTAVSPVQTLFWFGNENDFAIHGDYLFASKNLRNLQSLELGCKSSEVLTCVRRAQVHQNLSSLTLLVDKMPNRSALSKLNQLKANLGISIIDTEGNAWDNSQGYQPINNLDSNSP